MKNYYFAGAFTLLVCFAQAQSNHFTKGMLDYDWPITSMEISANEDHILCVLRSSQNGVGCVVYNNLGNTIFGAKIRDNDFSIPYQRMQVRLKNNAIYTVASWTYCDYYQQPALVKLDSACSEEWRTNIENAGEYPCFLPSADNTWWVIRDGDTPLKFDDQTGAHLETGNAVIPVFSDYLELGNDRYLTYGNAGLVIYNSALTQLAAAPLAISTTDAALLPNGKIAVLRGTNYLEVYNEALVLEKVTALPPTNNTWPASITVVNDTIQLLYAGEQFTGAALYSLTLDDLGYAPHPNEHAFQVYDMEAVGNNMLLAGVNMERVIGIKKEPLAKAFDYNFYTDVAVTSVKGPDTLYATIANSSISYRYSDVEVTIKNKGNQTIEGLRLHGFLDEYTFICPTEVWYDQKFSFAPLQPGDSVTIEIPKIDWGLPLFSASLHHNLCLRAVLPQDSLDANPTDNTACLGLIPVTTTVSTTQPALVPVQVAPNPATDQVRLTFPEGTYHLQLTDGLGRTVCTLDGSGQECIIQRNDLPGGLYFGRLELDNQRGYFRVVFE